MGLVFLLPRSLRKLGYRPEEAEALTPRNADAGAGTSVSPGGTLGE